MLHLLASWDANEKDKLSDGYLDFITCKGHIISLLNVETSQLQVSTLVILLGHK